MYHLQKAFSLQSDGAFANFGSLPVTGLVTHLKHFGEDVDYEAAAFSGNGDNLKETEEKEDDLQSH